MLTSDKDSACLTEGPSDESTPSQHNYDMPPDSFGSSPFSISSSGLDDPAIVPKDSRQQAGQEPLTPDDVFPSPPPHEDTLEHGSLVLKNPHAETASQSGEDAEERPNTLLQQGRHGEKRGSLPTLNQGEYLEPSHNKAARNRTRSPSSPAVS